MLGLIRVNLRDPRPAWSSFLRDLRENAVGRAPLLLLILASSACATHNAPGANPRAERALASDLARVFGAPVMRQAVWAVEVKSLDGIIQALDALKSSDGARQHHEDHKGRPRITRIYADLGFTC